MANDETHDACSCSCPADDKGLLVSQAQNQIGLVQVWAQRNRLDLAALYLAHAEKLIELAQAEGADIRAVQLDILTCRLLLADLAGKPVEETLALARQCVALAAAIYPEKHPAIAVARGNLGEILAKSGASEEARTELSQAIFILTDAKSVTEIFTKEYLNNCFINCARILQSLPPRPRI